MTPGIWIALIGAIASLGSAVLVFLAGKRITKLEINTNSIKDALVKKTGEEAFARGKKEGIEEKG